MDFYLVLETMIMTHLKPHKMTLYERNINEVRTVINDAVRLDQKVPHFSPTDEPLGELTDIQNLAVRLYVAQRRLKGYYLIFNDQKIIITKDGNLEIWPKGLYDDNIPLYKELFDTNKLMASSLDIRIAGTNIQELEKYEVFVFGSNEAGIHGAGAAKLAREKFGAVDRKGWGHHGQSYAIPTKDRRFKPLLIEAIQLHVNDFIKYAKENPQFIFLVTEIGCDLAGYRAESIAPLFKDAGPVTNIHLPLKFWNVLLTNL